MRLTDIPAQKADGHNPGCLHCIVSEAIEKFYRDRGQRHDGKVIIDVMEVASKLSEAIVEVILCIPDRSKRRRAMRFAHDALDGNLKSQTTGKLVEVDIPDEH
jgi:hypothetical protein